MTWLTRILNHFTPITPTAHYKISHSYPAQPGSKRRINESRKHR